MLTTKRVAIVLILLTSCGGSPPAVDSRVTAVVALQGPQLSIIDVRSLVPPQPAASGGSLRYQLQAPDGSVVAEGTLADPRHPGVDHAPVGLPSAGDRGLLFISLPPQAGELILWSRDESGWTELGRDRFRPHVRVPFDDEEEAEPVQLVGSQEPERSLNLVLLPEGFTEAELPKFHQIADAVVTSLHKQADLAAHWEQVSIYRIDVSSEQSGIDDPQAKLKVDTAFDVSFGNGSPADPRRLAFPRSSEGIARAVRLAGLVPKGIPAILVNTTDWCGSGGLPIVISPNVLEEGGESGFGGAMLVHELGHQLLDLADEYEYGLCRYARNAPNVSLSVEREQLPWKDLIDASTPLPTPLPEPETPAEGGEAAPPIGAYEGGAYCTEGVWRPTPNCLMREIDQPLCQVCRRHLDAYLRQLSEDPVPTDPPTDPSPTD